MALVIRYRCHACGAHVDSTGHAAWVRCGYCQALVGIDWQAWFESPAYTAWLRDYPQLVPKFTALQRHRDEAVAALRAGQEQAAERHLREVAALQMEATPQLFPPEVHTDAAYRERYVRYEAWVRLQTMVDPALVALNAQMETASQGLDIQNPLPTLERIMAVLRRYYDRLFTRPGSEDPDGMPPAARCHLTLTLTVNAYLPMLPAEKRLELLRRVHGVNNVRETHASASDEVGMFVEWTCPHCGLVSLQARTALELVCMGCYHKRPFSEEALGLREASTRCGACGHPVTLPGGTMERPCEVCGAQVRRFARTGAQEKQYTREMMARFGAEPPVLPEEGTPGMRLPGVTPEQQCLMGLGRQASWYATLVPLSRYVGLVRQSLPAHTDAERAVLLARVAGLPFFEGLSEEGRRRLEEARDVLLRR